MYITPPVPRPRHVVICAGGMLDASLLSVCNEADVVIGADRGALALANHGICPDVAIGDFDSVTEDERNQIRSCSKHYQDFDAIDKDYTDTELAFHTAIAWEPAQITLLGATGTRLIIHLAISICCGSDLTKASNAKLLTPTILSG